MHPTRLLLARTPLIKFLGKRVPPKTITPAAPADEPAPHPASPSHSLPDSFMAYRSKAQQHGPLGGHNRPSSSQPSASASSSPPPSSVNTSHAYGGIGGHSGHELGTVEPDAGKGEVWDRSELPKRFGRMAWTEDEIEALELGGANLRAGSLPVSLLTQRVVTARSTHNHDDLRTLPSYIVRFPFLSITFEPITFGIKQQLSAHREIKFSICSFSQLYYLLTARTGTIKTSIRYFGPSVVAMPSRQKKALRDSMLTQAFFNQAGNGICDCCSGPIHNNASSSLNLGDLNHEEVADTGSGDEKYNNLTPEEYQKLHTSDKIFGPRGVLRELNLALEQRNSEPAMYERIQPMETFDLGNLDEVAETYDKRCEIFRDEEERGMANLAAGVSDLVVIANDSKRSSDDRLAAELDIHNLNIFGKTILPLTSCLRQVQLFNVEKRFGFVEESYQALYNDEKKRRGEDVPAGTALSFRQKYNNPLQLTGSAAKPRGKGKKRLGMVKALVEVQRNGKLALAETQNLEKILSDAEKSIELPGLPASFSYNEAPIPDDIPDHIKRRFFDAESAYEEIMDLQEEATTLLCRVESTFDLWYSASQEAWESGKRIIHEMPLFREYEYTRISLHALFYVASRQEIKIVEYYSSEGAPKLPPVINQAFKLKSLSLEEFEKDWEMRCLALHDSFPSVDKKVADTDKMLKETGERDLPKSGLWKWLF